MPRRTGPNSVTGTPTATREQIFIGRLDHMHLLAAQASMAPFRVFYTASGSLLSAARVGVSDSICEHGAYWAAARTTTEAAYLIAILNSASVIARVADMQVQGEAGTRRHLNNLVWTLPIPEYDETDQVHRDMADAAAHAEEVAADVDLGAYNHFVAKRRAIREALVADGVARDIELLVDAILPQ
jgi:hypothetical protein